MPRLRISYNAPVVLTFALAAALVHTLSLLLGDVVKLWFVAWPEFVGLRSYLGLVTHILGHGNWDHLLSNFTMILLLGPILEERHGSRALLAMIGATALVTGLVNVAIADGFLLGASGIVFMMIVVASTANIRQGEIPLTFVAVVVLFLGREVYEGIVARDNVSQMAHLIGGAVGAAIGFRTARPRSGALPSSAPSRAGGAGPGRSSTAAALPAKSRDDAL